eukprot:tig00000881_g5224.t2
MPWAERIYDEDTELQRDAVGRCDLLVYRHSFSLAHSLSHWYPLAEPKDSRKAPSSVPLHWLRRYVVGRLALEIWRSLRRDAVGPRITCERTLDGARCSCAGGRAGRTLCDDLPGDTESTPTPSQASGVLPCDLLVYRHSFSLAHLLSHCLRYPAEPLDSRKALSSAPLASLQPPLPR